MISKKAAIIGYPIEHSLSPVMHNYWLDEIGIENASYEKISVNPDNLDSSLQKLWHDGYQGLNVTIPHKERVYSLCSELTQRALRLGSVNTLVRTNKGWKGDSTDGWGFVTALEDRIPLNDFGKKKVVVLGAGGAARSIIDALIERGIENISIFNRNQERAEKLAENVGSQQVRNIQVFSSESWDIEISESTLLIQTTSMGMAGGPPFIYSLESLKSDSVVVDIVYRPLFTDCLRKAQVRGCTIIDGLGMLMYQGLPGFEAWFGKTPKVTEKLRQKLIEVMGLR